MKMKRKMKSFLLLAGCVFALAGMQAEAAPKAKSIEIEEGSRQVEVGSSIELDSRVLPKRARVRDRNIIWSSSNPKVAKVLEKRDDDTKIKGLKPGTATITVRIRNTSIKAECNITVAEETAGSVKDYQKQIRELRDEYKKIYKDIKSSKVSSEFETGRKQYLDFDRRLDQVDEKADLLEDQLKKQYRKNKLTRKQYRSLDRRIEDLEDYHDRAEDYLERKYRRFEDLDD